MRRSIFIWLAVLAALAWHAVPARADLMASMNEIRAQGCGSERGGKPPLRRNSALDRVAQSLASGGDLKKAMAATGYRAVQTATLEVSGTDSAIEVALVQRGCDDIIDPVYREAGIAQRPGKAWIVLAAPFVPPAAGEARSVSRRVLELVNEVRARPRRCGWKRYGAAPPLALSDTLRRAALDHARELAERGELSHAGRDGSTPAERATRAGYRWRFVGENTAAGQPTAETVVAEWVKSPRHCSNLMDTDYTEMGVAYASDPAGAKGIYWVQVFGMPSP